MTADVLKAPGWNRNHQSTGVTAKVGSAKSTAVGARAAARTSSRIITYCQGTFIASAISFHSTSVSGKRAETSASGKASASRQRNSSHFVASFVSAARTFSAALSVMLDASVKGDREFEKCFSRNALNLGKYESVSKKGGMPNKKASCSGAPKDQKKISEDKQYRPFFSCNARQGFLSNRKGGKQVLEVLRQSIEPVGRERRRRRRDA